ncbi:MAG: hypothetical protein HOE48_06905 [Candidatus Latescibacteria bacterium]|nr:hypothetical protein [Candidatus Latescibacterota bacterium]MBT4137625.1 hypothetical protein [Candidatus Latescibacterota bacterium]MBT5832160.1 hypothetical protein [Candidatus Latescibacterota bacterium]
MNFTLGLPNGSMLQPTIDLLAQIGIDIRICHRNSRAKITNCRTFNSPANSVCNRYGGS